MKQQTLRLLETIGIIAGILSIAFTGAIMLWLGTGHHF